MSGSGGSSTVSTDVGSGGFSGSGGATAGGKPSSGCGCRVGGGRGTLGGLGVGIAVLAAGQLRRFLLRRDAVTRPRDAEDDDKSR
jgi:hypothetical protein